MSLVSRSEYAACARIIADASAPDDARRRAEATLAAATDPGSRDAGLNAVGNELGERACVECAFGLLELANGAGATTAEAHVACVVLANALGRSLPAMRGEERAACAREILAVLATAKDRAVIRAAVNCVDVLAQSACAMGGADGVESLCAQLEQTLVGNERGEAREASVLVFGALCESLGQRIASRHEGLLEMFMQALDDEDTRVKMAALDSIGKLASAWCVSPAIGPALARCAAMLVRGANVTLEIGDQRMLSALLDAMSALAGVREEVYGEHAQEALIHLLEVALRCATNPSLDAGSVRAPALHALIKMTKKHSDMLKETMAGQIDLHYDPHVLGVGGGPIAAALVPPMLSIALEEELEDDISNLDEDIEGEGLDEQSSSPAALARGALRALAGALPDTFVVTPMLNLLERSQASSSRHLAWKAFAAITEGADGNGITSHLPGLLSELTESIKTEDGTLRAAVTEAACAIATYCQPEVADEYSERTFELLAHMLMYSPRSSQWAVHAALNKLCENCVGESIMPSMERLMAALRAQAEDHSWRTASRAIASFGAVAQCALDYFTPYAEDVLNLLLARAKSADQTSNGGIVLQSRSIATMAIIVGVIGPEMAPTGLLELLLQTAAAALSSSETIARECAHECLGKLAVALETKFEPFAIEAASAAVAAMSQQDDGINTKSPVTTGISEEQIAAVDALGQYFNSGSISLRSVLPKTLEALALASDAKQSNALRVSALRASEFIFTPWMSGPTDDPNFISLVRGTFKLLCERVVNDSDSNVALAGIQSMSELLDKIKSVMAVPPDVLEATKDAAETIIQWRSVCQIEYEAAEEAAAHDDDGESDDDDIFDTMVFWAERIAPQDSDDDDSESS